jgi:hypothetical protein
MVGYFKIDGAPGDYFRCAPYATTMSVPSCASMYMAEKGCRDGRHPHCNGCAVGATHAGDTQAPSSRICGSKLCPRCHRPASRIVRGLCVSCVNRQYEIEKGKNAKGTKPVNLPTLRPCVLSVTIGRSVSETRFDKTTGMLEGMYRVLREQSGSPVFGWARVTPKLAQRSLF